MTTFLCDGRNRFPVDIKYTQTRKANDRRRIKILKENMQIIREGRAALIRRLLKEQKQAKGEAHQAQTASAIQTASATTANQ